MDVRVGIEWLEIPAGFSVRGMLVFSRSFGRVVEASSGENSLRVIKLEMQNPRSLILYALLICPWLGKLLKAVQNFSKHITHVLVTVTV